MTKSKITEAKRDAMRTVMWLGCLALGVVLSAPARAENIKIGIIIPYSGTKHAAKKVRL